jgi:hypothetical protein
MTNTIDSIARCHWDYQIILVMLNVSSWMKKLPNIVNFCPAPKRDIDRQRTKSADWKATIRRYTNVLPPTPSKFIPCRILSIHFCTSDMYSKAALTAMK